MDKILEVENLKVYYPVKGKKLFAAHKQYVKAVDGISFSVYRGETFGIVGESGCGKSTTGKAIMHLIEPTDGKIMIEGKDITVRNRKDRYDAAKKIQMIFQNSHSTLDSKFKIGQTIREPLSVHKIGSKEEQANRVLQLMEDVGLRKEYVDRYPHEFSGGQRQRIGIARAIALNPSIIVCDEPVSALDVSIQSQIINLMLDLQEKYNLTYIFISHNLAVVKHICDRVAVMYLGHIVEAGPSEQVFSNPLHPYTKALLSSIAIPDPEIDSMAVSLEGEVPSPLNPPKGCVFHTRCKYALEKCRKDTPAFSEPEKGHIAACHLCQS